MKSKYISIVIPVYNEDDGINSFHNDILLPALHDIKNYSFSVIYVNDGSRDKSLEKLHKLNSDGITLKIISLSRNFGKEVATTAGIFNAQGEATIIMDSDGQHPPAVLSDFIDKWEKGAQVVVGVRTKNHNEGMIKKYGSKIFYVLFNKISDNKLIPGATDYRLISDDVREEFIKLSESNRITRGLIDWLGFRRDYVEFSSPSRIAGDASYSFMQLVKLAVNSFVSLTLKPLFFFGYLGVFIMCASLLIGLFIIIEQFLLGDPMNLNITGAAMLTVFISFMVSLVLVSQAMIAIYLSHIYSASRNRPLFVINKSESKNI